MRTTATLVLALTLTGCTGVGAEAPDPRPTADMSEPHDGGPLTEAELAEALRTAPPGPPRSHEEALAHYWEGMGLQEAPPVVSPVGTVDIDEYDTIELRCMAEQGFPSHVDQLGQEGIEFSPDQADDLARATYTCMAMYPIDEKYRRPFTLDQLRAIYDWRVNETIPCMIADGVSPPEPPSFETFVGEYAATGYKHWSPRSEVEPPPEIDEDPALAMAWCPDTPPDDVLYGQR